MQDKMKKRKGGRIGFERCAVRRYFGMEIAELWINEGRGNCRYRVPDKGDIGLFQEIAASLAGRIAEDRVRGYANEDEWKASGDYARAFDCALRLNAGDKLGAELLLQWLERRTKLFMEKCWPQIAKLALALLAHGKLTGREVSALLCNGAPSKQAV